MLLPMLLACAQRHDPPPVPAEDPTDAWAALLAQAVTEDGWVRYDVLRADPAPLDAYAAWIAEPWGAQTADQELATLINAYNALVLWTTLQLDVQSSVQEITQGVFRAPPGAGFFMGQRVRVDDAWVHLYGLENKRIRGDFQDPRVHAAINCASAGCPPLRAALWTADTLDADLDHAMARFLATRSHIDGDTAVFSEIFDWFAADFTEWTDAPDLCAYAGAYDPAYLDLDGCPHRFEPYDWALNAAPL